MRIDKVVRLVLYSLVLLISSAMCQAAFLNCTYETSCSDTAVLYVSNTTNAHAQLPSVATYPYVICCRDNDLDSTVGTAASGTALFGLEQTTNSHVEKPNSTHYSNIVYISAVNLTFDTVCYFVDTNGDCSSTANTCVATYSNYTNAHISDCVTAPYERTLCCSLIYTGGGPGEDVIPEFSGPGVIISILVILIGMTFIVNKNNNPKRGARKNVRK